MRRLIALIAACVAFPSTGDAQAKWLTNFEAAKKAQSASGKPLLIDFSAEWCGPCRKMEAETFTDPRIQALFKKIELLRLDVDRRPPQAKTYGVNSIPRLILLPAGGGQPLLDLRGYCDADELSRQLRSALGLGPEDIPAPPTESQGLSRVRRALQTGQYAAMKASDPKGTASGLEKLVEQLGTKNEVEYKPAADIVRKAGDDAVPFLIRSLGHAHLAVRAASYRTLQEMLQGSSLLPFDAWAPAKARKSQAARWSQWWSERTRRRVTAR
jgi:thiol-disulfide isomerase/thioredoxin